MNVEILAIGIFLFLGIFASKLSSVLKIPILLVFLVVGMIAGSDGIGKIPYENFEHASYLGTVALGFILFSGGYDTNWKDIQPVMVRGMILATLGILLTALLLGTFTACFLGMPFYWGFLLGSVISSTDAAAVFALFRSKSFSLKGNLKPLLEFESGSNDPMAAFLTIFILELIMSGHGSWWMVLPSFLQQMSIGIFMGWLIALGGIWIFNHINLEFEGLYYVIGIAIVLFTLSFTTLCHGNGLIAVYTGGLVMGNSRFLYKYGLARFNDGLAWLMQVSIFLLLGLLVTPHLLAKYWFSGVVIGFVLMIIVRPIVVAICLLFSKYSWKEQTLISWGGFRGAAPIVFATMPVYYEVTDSIKLFHIVFFIVLTSIFIQGKTLMPLAKQFRLNKKVRESLRSPIEFEETGHTNDRIFEYHITENSNILGKTLADLALPGGTLVLLIRRKDRFIVPNGQTPVCVGDDLIVFYNPLAFPSLEKILLSTNDSVSVDTTTPSP